MLRAGAAGVLLLVGALFAPAHAAATTATVVRPGPDDWPTYGHDPQRSFHGVTSLTAADAPLLAPAWFFGTGDAVTANPIVVQDSVYVGSWDGNFYALNRATGALRWKFAVKPQPSVNPVPGQLARDPTSDGGLITSSAWYESGNGRRPNLVIFGGGYTLYALDAGSGALYWSRDFTGLPEKPPDPANDEARIFSSPAVVGDRVLFAVTSDGQNGHRGYVVAADLATGKPVWTFETDVDAKTGKVRNDGCGGVWSSPSILESRGLMVLDVADCNFNDTRPYDETVFALHIADGKVAWVFHPPRPDAGCDWDFGASANNGTTTDGMPFLGVGGKDGTYYSLDGATGQMRWQRNVVFGGFAGGFIGSTAFDGNRVYGATALGDFGRFEAFGAYGCQLGNPRDMLIQEPSLHAIDAKSGAVLWQQPLSQSFGPTTTGGDMVFIGTGIARSVKIHDAATGRPVGVLPLDASSDSGIIPAGNALFFGTGSSEQGALAGVHAYTPLGVAPTWRPPPSVAAPAPGGTAPPAPPQVGARVQGETIPVTGDGVPRLAIAATLVSLALVSSRWGRALGRRTSIPGAFRRAAAARRRG